MLPRRVRSRALSVAMMAAVRRPSVITRFDWGREMNRHPTAGGVIAAESTRRGTPDSGAKACHLPGGRQMNPALSYPASGERPKVA
jgi:hypothetical protein